VEPINFGKIIKGKCRGRPPAFFCPRNAETGGELTCGFGLVSWPSLRKTLKSAPKWRSKAYIICQADILFAIAKHLL
jgi:hypothetical protein